VRRKGKRRLQMQLRILAIGLALTFWFTAPKFVAAQEKVRFPIGESSKTLSYGPLWVAGKMGFFDKEGLDMPIVK